MKTHNFPDPAICKTFSLPGGYWSCLTDEADYCPYRFMFELKYYVCKHPENYKYSEDHKLVSKPVESKHNTVLLESRCDALNVDNTILLVDDNKLFLEIEKEFLRYTHANILIAQNGLEVLELLKTTQPDVIFMDFEMPKMDGATCCKEIRANPATANIPIVMVTSRGQEEVVEHCYAMGCEYFLTKPLDRDVFLSTARKFIPTLDRREKRISVSLDAVLQVRAEKVRCEVHDLSSGGAFLSTEYFAYPNSIAQITFTLPNGTLIECHCRFAWINRKIENHPHGIGIRFALMPKEMQEVLNTYIASSIM